MGIYDREYIRSGRKTPGAVGGMRMWSFNTWLIVINVAVFFLGGVLGNATGLVAVDMGTFHDRNASSVQIERAVEAPAAPSNSVRFRRVLVDPQTQEVVGFHEYQWMQPLEAYFHFSTAKFFGLEVWRLIGFQFLHANFTHLLFNMIGLYFFGGLVEGYLGFKRYAAFYLVSGICGALMYLVLNGIGFLVMQSNPQLHIPGLLFNNPHMPLIGASAGVFGVLMAAAFVAPNARILVFFILPMRLATAAYGMAILAFINLVTGAANAGGEAAHMGGALAGFFFIRHTHLLHDFFDIFGSAKKAGAGARDSAARKISRAPSDGELDRILSKVATGGLHSLTEAERRTLRRATESRRR